MSNEDRGDMERQQRLRESAIRNLSPGARHQAFPHLFAMPLPRGDDDHATVARLTRENAVLLDKVARLTRERNDLSAQLAASTKAACYDTNGRNAKIAKVQNAFCEELAEIGYSVNRAPYTRDRMLNDQRSREMSWPRHVCMDLVRRLCPDSSLPEIGRMFHRDHTACLHGIRRTPEHLATDPVLEAVHTRVMARFGAVQP